jgi:DNA-binding LytR/AlgR family response regulator
LERFLKAVNRYCLRTRTGVREKADSPGTPNKKCIFIQDGKNVFKLPHDDVNYFEGYGEYVKVITTSKTYLVRDSLSEFENRLPVESFLRIHKSYIVNLNKITGFSSTHVLLKNSELPVGRMYREKAVSVLRSEKSF